MDIVEIFIKSIVSPNIIDDTKPPICIQSIASVWNFENTAPTILMDISVKPGIVENIQLGQTYSSKEVKLYKDLFK